MPQSTGRPGELVVVIDNHQWESQIGESIRACFGQYLEGLPQEEPIFRIVNIPNASFSGILQRHRNIIVVNVADTPENKEGLTLKKNSWASGQLVVKITAPGPEAFASIVNENCQMLTSYFSDKELERLKANLAKNEDKTIRKKLQERHGLSLTIPKEYVIALDTTNFVWIRNEVQKPSGGDYHQIIRGILIYYDEYTDKQQLSKEHLLSIRDSLTKIYVPGPTPGSYMQMVEEYPANFKEINFNESYAVELRGLWNLHGDFMGGPFLSLTTVDTTRNRVVTAEAFLYSPKFDKREYLRELEAILHTLSFE